MHPQPTGAYGVMNTLRALERLAITPHSSTELADKLKIDARTARRILQRLAAEGYASQDDGPRRRYRATLRLAATGRQQLERSGLPRIALPAVAELATATSCTAHLWIPAPEKAVCLIHAGDAGEPDDGPPVLVLDRTRLRQRSCAYAEDAAAAAVLDGGMVIAAIGISGPVTDKHLGVVVRVADALSATLASR